MIRIGILGADSPQAGEVIRILVNHPDADLRSLVAPTLKGTPVAAHHHGLTGDTSLEFTDELNLDKLNLLIVAPPASMPDDIPEDIRVIDMRSADVFSPAEGFSYGLSEINRKELVRGATRSVTASPIAAITLISLFPFFQNKLLKGEVRIEVSLPEEFPAMEAEKEIAGAISRICPVAEVKVTLNTSNSEAARAMRLKTVLNAGIDPEQAENLFEDIYDDHRFTFVVPPPPRDADVEGTHKCLIAFTPGENEGELAIEAVADAYMRGGAGETVHLLNLLFGLHEKTGLALKASNFSIR